MANYMTTTVSQHGAGKTTVERFYGSDETYRKDTSGLLAALVLRTGAGTYVYPLEEAKKLAEAMTAIVESVEALRPRKLTFHEELNAALVGTKLFVKVNGGTYTKIEGGKWESDSGYRQVVGVWNFGGPADAYTLTPPAPAPTFHDQLQAAEVGSTVKVGTGGSTYTKGNDGRWRIAGRGHSYRFTDFRNNASDYTLTPPLTWTEQKVNAPTGSKLLNNDNGVEFVKLGTGDWVSLRSGRAYGSVDNFTREPSTYTLTLADAK